MHRQARRGVVPNRIIQIIANPGAGQEGLNLKTVQTIFSAYPVEWDVSITKEAGDATLLAKAAAEAGADVVAIYGGDGSVAETAAALAGVSRTCLAILPGGTANVMSVELGIPGKLEDALRVAADPASQVRTIDMGVVNKRPFVLRVGMGLEAEMVAGADREAKNRFGVFAYLWSGLQNIARPQPARYQLVLDGQQVETDGLTCIVANSGNMGQAGLNLIPTIAVDDGLLDVIVIGQAGVKSFFDVAGAILGLAEVQPEQRPTRYTQLGAEMRSSLQYWQVKEVHVACEPPQAIQSDGELLDAKEVHCQIQQGALRVLTPPS
jgi:YegS/Rv2252/BmrU family lipid kinase